MERPAPDPRTVDRLDGLSLILFIRSLRLGGSERQAVLLADYLQSRCRCSVLLWAFADGGPVAELAARRAIPVHVQSPGVAVGWFTRARLMAGFVDAIRRHKPDVLLPLTDLPNKICCSVWPLTGARACLWNQRDEGREVTGRLLERLALRNATHFVANSEVGAAFLHKRLGVEAPRISVIGNGVALDDPAREVDEWRTELALEDHTAAAVMVANLQPFKDHSTLLRAWRTVVDGAAPPPVLLLAGRFDSSHGELLALADELGLGEHVRFLGEVDDIPGLLGACQLAVFSSKLEGCPNGVLEPMAAGLPVVATDIIGTREALGENSPYLVPADDPQAFAETVLRLVSDPHTRSDVGRHNRQRVQRLFEPGLAFARYAEVVADAIATTAKPRRRR